MSFVVYKKKKGNVKESFFELSFERIRHLWTFLEFSFTGEMSVLRMIIKRDKIAIIIVVEMAQF